MLERMLQEFAFDSLACPVNLLLLSSNGTNGQALNARE